jgi:hypothetical protein
MNPGAAPHAAAQGCMPGAWLAGDGHCQGRRLWAGGVRVAVGSRAGPAAATIAQTFHGRSQHLLGS